MSSFVDVTLTNGLNNVTVKDDGRIVKPDETLYYEEEEVGTLEKVRKDSIQSKTGQGVFIKSGYLGEVSDLKDSFQIKTPPSGGKRKSRRNKKSRRNRKSKKYHRKSNSRR